MFVSKQDWIAIDGEVVAVSLQGKGSSVKVVGLFRGHWITGTGCTESAAKSSWKRKAEYEVNR